jgi:hypothetical protein
MKRNGVGLILAFVATSLFGRTVRAAEDACFAAAVEGQKLERAGKLLDARTRFVACGQSTCDATVIEKCQGWLGGVEKKIPSVSLALRDGDGRDIAATRATIDGADVETVIVREGEKGRVVLLHARAPADIPIGPRDEPSRAMLYGAITFGGVAVASGGVFAIFSAKGISDRSRFGCAVGCSPDHYQTVHHEFLGADIALGVAVGSLAVATTLFLIRPKSAPAQALLFLPASAPAAPLRFTF